MSESSAQRDRARRGADAGNVESAPPEPLAQTILSSLHRQLVGQLVPGRHAKRVRARKCQGQSDAMRRRRVEVRTRMAHSVGQYAVAAQQAPLTRQQELLHECCLNMPARIGGGWPPSQAVKAWLARTAAAAEAAHRVLQV